MGCFYGQLAALTISFQFHDAWSHIHVNFFLVVHNELLRSVRPFVGVEMIGLARYTLLNFSPDKSVRCVDLKALVALS